MQSRLRRGTSRLPRVVARSLQAETRLPIIPMRKRRLPSSRPSRPWGNRWHPQKVTAPMLSSGLRNAAPAGRPASRKSRPGCRWGFRRGAGVLAGRRAELRVRVVTAMPLAAWLSQIMSHHASCAARCGANSGARGSGPAAPFRSRADSQQTAFSRQGKDVALRGQQPLADAHPVAEIATELEIGEEVQQVAVIDGFTGCGRVGFMRDGDRCRPSMAKTAS